MCLKKAPRRVTSCVANFELSVEVVGQPVHERREMEEITHLFPLGAGIYCLTFSLAVCSELWAKTPLSIQL